MRRREGQGYGYHTYLEGGHGATLHRGLTNGGEFEIKHIGALGGDTI